MEILAFRLHIIKELENKNAERLGDRTLAVRASTRSDGIYAFATYTYTNLNGAGNPNLYKAIPYGKDLKSWHFIIFAYSKDKKKAAGFVQFKERKEIIDLDDNHFLNEVVYLNIGKDRFYPKWVYWQIYPQFMWWHIPSINPTYLFSNIFS